MASNYPPVPPYQPQYVPPAKKSNVLLWVLLIIGGIVVFCVLAVAGIGYFVVHKAKQAGFDSDLMRRNPQLAAVKIAAALNPDIEVVSYDDSKNTVTVKNKKTGETTTMSFDDAKNGRWTVNNSKGKTTFGDNVDLKLPSWIPKYPGAKPTGSFASEAEGTSAGSFQFSTGDSAEEVARFYQDEFKAGGMKVSKNLTSDGDQRGGMVSGQLDDRSVVAVITSEGNGSHVNVTYKTGKE